jgi:hypothetical protein
MASAPTTAEATSTTERVPKTTARGALVLSEQTKTVDDVSSAPVSADVVPPAFARATGVPRPVSQPPASSGLAPCGDEKKGVRSDDSAISSREKSRSDTSVRPTDDDDDEPLLKENKQRFVLFPIKYDAIWKMYKKHEASVWTAEEVDLGSDMKDWVKLNSGEQHFIKMVLAFFAASDGIVLENLAERFLKEVQIPEARCMVAGSLVSMTDGTSKPIETINVGESVLGWSVKHKKVVSARVTHLKPKGGDAKPTVCVTLEDGRAIECTPDHHFLMRDGTYVEAQHLMSSGQRVSVSCDFPAAISSSADEIKSWSLSLGALGTLDVGPLRAKAMAFARLCGYVLTDGSGIALGRSGEPNMRCWVATDVGKSLILDDIELLSGIRPKPGANAYSIDIPERLALAMHATDPVAFAAGVCIDKPFCLPAWVTREACPRAVVSEFLAGLFGGDGGRAPCLGGPSGKFALTDVAFSQSKSPAHVDSLRTGFGQIVAMLGALGVKTRVAHATTNEAGAKQLHIAFVGDGAIMEFAEKVGFRYDMHKAVCLTIAATYCRKRDACSAFYNDVILTANAIKSAEGGAWEQAAAKAVADVRSRREQIGTDVQCVPGHWAIVNQAALDGECGHPVGGIEKWATSVGALQLMRGGGDKQTGKDVEDEATKRSNAEQEGNDGDEVAGTRQEKKETDADVGICEKKTGRVQKAKSYAVKPKDRGLPVFFLEVVSVVTKSPRIVFDLSVEDPINSFVVAGCLVHNCKPTPLSLSPLLSFALPNKKPHQTSTA